MECHSEPSDQRETCQPEKVTVNVEKKERAFTKKDLWLHVMESNSNPCMSNFQLICIGWLKDRYPKTPAKEIFLFPVNLLGDTLKKFKQRRSMKLVLAEMQEYFSQKIPLKQYDEKGLVISTEGIEETENSEPDSSQENEDHSQTMDDDPLSHGPEPGQLSSVRLWNKGVSFMQGFDLNIHADTVLVASGGHSIHLNRALLAAASPVLRKIMDGATAGEEIVILTPITDDDLIQFHSYVTQGVAKASGLESMQALTWLLSGYGYMGINIQIPVASNEPSKLSPRDDDDSKPIVASDKVVSSAYELKDEIITEGVGNKNEPKAKKASVDENEGDGLSSQCAINEVARRRKRKYEPLCSANLLPALENGAKTKAQQLYDSTMKTQAYSHLGVRTTNQFPTKEESAKHAKDMYQTITDYMEQQNKSQGDIARCAMVGIWRQSCQILSSPTMLEYTVK